MLELGTGTGGDAHCQACVGGSGVGGDIVIAQNRRHC